tara:strand:- start:67 stop:351 length:285 start_codon:yes stop_codon:yes gene_type:complete
MVKKFDVYINVEDVYSFRVEAENEDKVNDLLDEMFNEYGTDFYGFLEDRRVEKTRHETTTDYQIDIIELVQQAKADKLIQKNITERMKWDDLDD